MEDTQEKVEKNKSDFDKLRERYQAVRKDVNEVLNETFENKKRRPKSIAREAVFRMAERKTLDPLTSLLKREYFQNKFEEELKKAKRLKYALGIAVVDADGLKEINDNDPSHHLEGDKYLKDIGSTIKNSIREIDFAGRTGGDEFQIIFPGTNSEGMEKIKERIEKAMKQANLNVSIGMAEINPEEVDKSIIEAENRMYEEKRKHKALKNS